MERNGTIGIPAVDPKKLKGKITIKRKVTDVKVLNVYNESGS